MPLGPGQRVLAVADDLSGAAETAAALLSRTTRTRVLLDPRTATPAPAGTTTVFDLDSRQLSATGAAARITAVMTGLAPGTLVLKKVDSLLRGNLAAEIAALAATGRGVLLAPALPTAHRTVRDGVLHTDGVPLHTGNAWRAETAPPPRSIAEALRVPVALLGLTAVRGPAHLLRTALREALATGLPVVADAETDADLDTLLAAALDVDPRVALAGSGGLALALGRSLGSGPPAPLPPPGPAARPLLVVVGTAEPLAAEQVRRLVTDGAALYSLDPGATYPGDPLPPLSPGTTVLTLRRNGPPDPTAARTISRNLARTAATLLDSAPGPADLVLTGGETARRVLEALGVRELRPWGQVHHGAVLATTPDGRTVVTRPGSFGDADSLRLIARALRAPTGGSPTAPTPAVRTPTARTPAARKAVHPPPAPGHPAPKPPRTSHDHAKGPFMNATPAAPAGTAPTAAEKIDALPVIAVTMGDGAGIGPEVIVPALLDPGTLSRIRPVVVGDAERLRRAAELVGLAGRVEIVTVEGPGDAEFTPGRINVIDLGLLPADLPWGTLSAIAGDAAYQYVRVAAELALSGAVQGICTAPLNKEALHAGGHLYPGHTELLAHLTGVEEVSMMLSTDTVKVIHVTTHIGLIDAVKRIEPGLVERTVRRGHDALVRAGVEHPVIGVCGINPHAGENGLFGYGEEEEKIVPALEILRADGIDARGPLPADTAFFLAGRGDYDLIVAMYHDQGHGPVKILGLEAGVNLTVGLPVIRTSVDHGTAFDIAGTGTADPGSMIEALRQAAALAPSPTG
ncbi:4-hydroxythreonine-4-phosphate dehydrogenase PdxA [Streptomyces sp. NPDC059943]|uniref:4-hydroxythreonine-4-phosphate dehydrogenase PdxA n=1 Tax=Streptomyces sp. NPDC059943 TaxID=3347010 RepID=UPI0036500CE3